MEEEKTVGLVETFDTGELSTVSNVSTNPTVNGIDSAEFYRSG